MAKHIQQMRTIEVIEVLFRAYALSMGEVHLDEEEMDTAKYDRLVEEAREELRGRLWFNVDLMKNPQVVVDHYRDQTVTCGCCWDAKYGCPNCTDG